MTTSRGAAGIDAETDELGFGVVDGKIHVHNLHATLLRQLGFDHERLMYRFQVAISVRPICTGAW
jgi:hypothetical protein